MQTLFTVEYLKAHDLFLVIPVLGRREYEHVEFVFSDPDELRLFLYVWHNYGADDAIRRYEHLERLALWNESYG